MCKIENSVLCAHCAVEEDILHLLWECEVAKNFWKNICNWINQSTVPLVNIEVTEKLIILEMNGNFVQDPVMDLILLLSKYYIYIILAHREKLFRVFKVSSILLNRNMPQKFTKVNVRMCMKQKNVGKNTSL